MSLAQRKFKLSKGLLQMKFMQRSKVKQMQDEAAEEGRTMYQCDITEGMIAGEDKFLIEGSYVPLEGLIEGRLSYGGMSPHIEKLMSEAEDEARSRLVSMGAGAELDADVSAEEAARALLTSTLGAKFKTKRERKRAEGEGEGPPAKYKGMMRPKEED